MKFTVENALNHPLVHVKRVGAFRVLKYKRKVFFDSLWDDVLINCRGLVINDNNEIVVRPFKKIFNYGVEKQAPTIKDSRLVYAQRKVNGFMLSVARVNDELILATTGDVWTRSFGESKNDFISMARKHVDANVHEIHDLFDFYESTAAKPGPVTLMFEVVDVDDPHIIVEIPGLYFLAAHVKNQSYFPLEYKGGGLLAAVAVLRTFEEVREAARACAHEGYVVRDVDGTLLTKIKSPFYLINKFLARSAAWKRILESEDKRRAYELVDEEYYSLVDHIFENKDAYSTMSEQEKLSFLRMFYRSL